MNSFQGKKVLITGGASGIGKLMGRMLLEKQAEVIIWDKDSVNLEKTLAMFSVLGRAYAYEVDLTEPDQISDTAAKVRAEVGAVDILINNAGIVVGKYFHEHSSADILTTMDVNANAPMLVAIEFLPEMVERNSGHICNIASSAGLVSNPRMSVYAASKWAVVGWSDSLRLEMQQLKKKVRVTTVTPYYISTGMFKGVRSRIPILEPEVVARKILKGIEKNDRYVSMPWSVPFVRMGQGLLPARFYDWFVGGVLGVYRSMDQFEGRKTKTENND